MTKRKHIFLMTDLGLSANIHLVSFIGLPDIAIPLSDNPSATFIPALRPERRCFHHFLKTSHLLFIFPDGNILRCAPATSYTISLACYTSVYAHNRIFTIGLNLMVSFRSVPVEGNDTYTFCLIQSVLCCQYISSERETEIYGL